MEEMAQKKLQDEAKSQVYKDRARRETDSLKATAEAQRQSEMEARKANAEEIKKKTLEKKLLAEAEKEYQQQQEIERNKKIALEAAQKKAEIEASAKARQDEINQRKAELLARMQALDEARKKASADLLASKQARLEALKKANETPNRTVDNGVVNTAAKSTKEIYLEELAKKYPEGKSEETEDTDRFRMVRIIIVKGGKATEYKKIAFNFGMTSYKRNDLDISEQQYKQETR
jgi:hypothetical protein